VGAEVGAPAASGTSRGAEAGWRALHRDGCLREARQHFDADFERAERAGDAEGMATAAIGLGGLWVHEHRGGAAYARVLRRQRQALALLPDTSPLHLQLRLRITAESDYAADRHDTVVGLLDEARATGGDTVLAGALSLAQHCLLGPEHGVLRRDLAEEMLMAAQGSARESDPTMALLWRTVDRFLQAHPHAERSLIELGDALVRRPNRAVEFVARSMGVMLDIRAGRLVEAERAAEECARLGWVCGDLDAGGYLGAHMVAIRWYQGRVEEILPLVHQQVHSPALSTNDSAMFVALAVAAAQAGDRRAAAGALARLGGGDPARLPSSSTRLSALFGAVEAAALLGDRSTAQGLYDLLLPFRALPVMVSLAVACFGSAEHALGVAALTTGRREVAVEHLTRAVRKNLALGHWPAAVLSRRRLAEALLLRDAPGDRGLADRELALAGQESVELGMRPGGPPPRPAVELAARGARPTDDRVLLTRRGREWRIDLGRRTAVVQHTVGMLYLAQLLARPGQEVPATELAGGWTGNGAQGDRQAGDRASDDPVLDPTARREYRHRLQRLEADLAGRAGASSAPHRAALESERQWLQTQLATTTGLGRRPREFTDNSERARIAVGKAIRRALDRISAADVELGEQLRAAVRTGVRCCYQPAVTATLPPAPPR